MFYFYFETFCVCKDKRIKVKTSKSFMCFATWAMRGIPISKVSTSLTIIVQLGILSILLIIKNVQTKLGLFLLY